MPPPSVTEESPSSGKSKPILSKPAPTTESPLLATSRPLPVPVLGNKGAECFAWSAAHDDDAEFLRRYGEPERAKFMLSFHAGDPAAAAACLRLSVLTKTIPV